MDQRQRAAERIAGALAQAGMARLPARMFAALLVDDDGRMTSAELTKFLGASAAGISGAVKYLLPVGLVRREREPGSRRDVYVVDDDAWHTAMTRHDQLYGPIRAALAAGRELLGEESPADVRLDRAVQFLLFLEGELDGILARWEVRRKELGLD